MGRTKRTVPNTFLWKQPELPDISFIDLLICMYKYNIVSAFVVLLVVHIHIITKKTCSTCTYTHYVTKKLIATFLVTVHHNQIRI